MCFVDFFLVNLLTKGFLVVEPNLDFLDELPNGFLVDLLVNFLEVVR